jgi:hypothetical protein
VRGVSSDRGESRVLSLPSNKDTLEKDRVAAGWGRPTLPWKMGQAALEENGAIVEGAWRGRGGECAVER